LTLKSSRHACSFLIVPGDDMGGVGHERAVLPQRLEGMQIRCFEPEPIIAAQGRHAGLLVLVQAFGPNAPSLSCRTFC
jgi:hypothetical protein